MVNEKVTRELYGGREEGEKEDGKKNEASIYGRSYVQIVTCIVHRVYAEKTMSRLVDIFMEPRCGDEREPALNICTETGMGLGVI